MPKDLIIVRAGRRSLHYSWLDATKPRSWELLVCPYEEIPPAPPGINGLLVSAVIPTSAKYAALKVLLQSWQEWRDYRYIMLADEDIFATQATWSSFFDRCAQLGARHAQPALSESSSFSHIVTVRNTEFVARRVTFVETMMPCFRADILPEILATFDQSKSGEGWGLDFLWSKMLGYKDVFVIDDTPALYTRSVTSRYSSDAQAALTAEMTSILRENKVPWLSKTVAGILPSGQELAEGDPSFLYRLSRGYENMFSQAPPRFDEFVRLQLATVPAG